MYIHPCLVFVDILGKSVFHIFVKEENLEKPFLNSDKNFQCPKTRKAAGGFHSTLVLNL